MPREDDNDRLGRAGWIEGNELVGIHVTDDPHKVAEVLKSGKDIGYSYGEGEQRMEELGPGLYMSATPQLWMGRSPGKYDFAKRLTPDQKKRLGDAILRHPNMEGGYLTSFEKGYVQRDVEAFLANDTPEAIHHIVGLAAQPYNIRFWEPEFLEPLGIRPGSQPEQVEVRAKGKFVDLSKHESDHDMIQAMKQKGFDGAFAKLGMISIAQCCIWKTRSITKFGEYYP